MASVTVSSTAGAVVSLPTSSSERGVASVISYKGGAAPVTIGLNKIDVTSVCLNKSVASVTVSLNKRGVASVAIRLNKTGVAFVVVSLNKGGVASVNFT